MKYRLITLLILSIAIFAKDSIIEKEKAFLDNDKKLSQEELQSFFGMPQDSMKKNGLKLLIWDNLFGKMTLHSAPPYKPLDSASSFGKRVIHVVIDSNNFMKEYDYWDYTNPEDFIKRGLIKNN
jgi:hypothetical protein